jgi:hypothetical protein
MCITWLSSSKVLSPSWEANSCSTIRKFPAFHGNRRTVAVFRIHERSLSGTKLIQSTHFYPISSRCILILFPHLRLCIPNGLFSSDYTSRPFYAFLLCPFHATIPAHLILIILIVSLYSEDHIIQFSPATCYCILPGPIIVTICSRTASVCVLPLPWKAVSFASIQNGRQNDGAVYFNLYFLD